MAVPNVPVVRQHRRRATLAQTLKPRAAKKDPEMKQIRHRSALIRALEVKEQFEQQRFEITERR